MKRTLSKLLSLLLVLALLIPSLSVGAEQSEGVSAVIDTRLEPVLSKADSVAEVIVTFKGGKAPGQNELNLLKSVGISKGITFQSLPMAGIIATGEQIKKLASLPEVQSIYSNYKLEYENSNSTFLTGVDKVRKDSQMTKKNGGMPVSGKGVTVLVNDSGIDGTHKDIEYGRTVVQNVAGATNLHAIDALLPVTYIENVPNTDTAGHGTHVAGIVGGSGAMSNGKYEGVAPGVNLVGYGSGAALFILDTLGGFDYALTHQHEYNIRAVTNSWGNTGDVGTDFDPNDPTNIATKALHDRGVAIIFSAGNSGPGESTITGNFKKAPWVICVAAGDKDGKLADFSSRGVEGKGGTVSIDGETFTWEDRPTVTAPGVSIISTRALADPLAPLNLQGDAEQIKTAYVPYYTALSGTSMATPHVAGIVALMLDANPLLSPTEVKEILEKTATNIPGREPWEVGAGYVNAYAAVDYAFEAKDYGSTLNLERTFNSNVNVDKKREDFSVNYDPLLGGSHTFELDEGITELSATVYGKGLADSGNPINLVLTAPDGTEYSSGVSLLFALYYDRTVVVPSPMAGTWKVEIRGLRGDAANPIGVALPETVEGVITTHKSSGYSGMGDIASHSLKDSIIMAVSNRIIDGYPDGKFRPNKNLNRKELANYLTMGVGIRQYLPPNGFNTFSDVSLLDKPFAEAVSARGAALQDGEVIQQGVMLPTADGKFSPDANVTRLSLAYALVQSLGLEKEAVELGKEMDSSNKPVVVRYGSNEIVLSDSSTITPSLRGYVQLAFDLNILSAEDFYNKNNLSYKLENGELKLTGKFEPSHSVTRGEYALFANRLYTMFLK